MSSELVKCPKCGRTVPKRKFCMNCGAPLEESLEKAKAGIERKEEAVKPQEEVVAEVEKQVEEAVREATEEKIIQEVKEKEKKEAPRLEELITSTKPRNYHLGLERPRVEGFAPRRRTVEKVENIEKIFTQISTTIKWRVKLLDIAGKNGLSETILDLYREYSKRETILGNMVKPFLTSIKRRVAEISKKKAELKEQLAKGEISFYEYISRKIELDRSLEASEDMLRQKPLFSYDEAAKLLEILNSEEVKALHLPDDVKKDVERIRGLLEDILSQKQYLKRELDKLELRFKVGEITEEEYKEIREKLLAELSA